MKIDNPGHSAGIVILSGNSGGYVNQPHMSIA